MTEIPTAKELAILARTDRELLPSRDDGVPRRWGSHLPCDLAVKAFVWGEAAA